jgi:hypothetical protein
MLGMNGVFEIFLAKTGGVSLPAMNIFRAEFLKRCC